MQVCEPNSFFIVSSIKMWLPLLFATAFPAVVHTFSIPPSNSLLTTRGKIRFPESKLTEPPAVVAVVDKTGYAFDLSNPSSIKNMAAIGDSYSSGLGAGKILDDEVIPREANDSRSKLVDQMMI